MKRLVRKLLNSFHYDLTRSVPSRPSRPMLIPLLGRDPYRDMAFFTKHRSHPTILDIGANEGQSVHRFRKAIPNAILHSFEPSPTTFISLSKSCKGLPNMNVWNLGVGAKEGTLALNENSFSDMSSFLSRGEMGWGSEVASTEVDLTTVDAFTAKHGIDFVDVLKSDTQGFEHEVFQGGKNMLANGQVGLVYFEFTFTQIYRELPRFEEVFGLLSQLNYLPVTFYEMHFQEHLLGWTDLLFIHPDYYKNRFGVSPRGMRTT